MDRQSPKRTSNTAIAICKCNVHTRAADEVHMNLRAGSTFPVPVCTVPHGHWVNKADTQQD